LKPELCDEVDLLRKASIIWERRHSKPSLIEKLDNSLTKKGGSQAPDPWKQSNPWLLDATVAGLNAAGKVADEAAQGFAWWAYNAGTGGRQGGAGNRQGNSDMADSFGALENPDAWETDIPSKALNNFAEEVVKDVLSHTIEVCFATFGVNGVDFSFAKCNLGMSCSNCTYLKFEARVSFDMCEGFKLSGKVGLSVMTPIVEGKLAMLDILQLVVDELPSEAKGVTAGSLASRILEIAVENSGLDEYKGNPTFKFGLNWEAEAGVGAGVEARVGMHLCNQGRNCFGGEVFGAAVAKIALKFFVCFYTGVQDGDQKWDFTVEIGFLSFTATLRMKYEGDSPELLDSAFAVDKAGGHVGALTVETDESIAETEKWWDDYWKGVEARKKKNDEEWKKKWAEIQRISATDEYQAAGRAWDAQVADYREEGGMGYSTGRWE